jgi:hypothetical protein
MLRPRYSLEMCFAHTLQYEFARIENICCSKLGIIFITVPHGRYTMRLSDLELRLQVNGLTH